jgi:hypothetical protein
MIDKHKSINFILEAVYTQLNNLTSLKKTGKIELTLEINMTQGFIGSAYLQDNSKNCIFSSKEGAG